MRKFSTDFTALFKGLHVKEVVKKKEPSGLVCHNIVPENDEGYYLHEEIIDLNSTGTNWT